MSGSSGLTLGIDEATPAIPRALAGGVDVSSVSPRRGFDAAGP
jgi:hypothetical protein